MNDRDSGKFCGWCREPAVVVEITAPPRWRRDHGGLIVITAKAKYRGACAEHRAELREFLDFEHAEALAKDERARRRRPRNRGPKQLAGQLDFDGGEVSS